MPEPRKKTAVEAAVSDGYTADEAISITEDLQEEPPVVDHRLRETGNGPTVSYEEALLREIYGEPDAEGVYR